MPNLSPPIPVPFDSHVSFLCLWVYLCFLNKFICIIYKIPHVSDSIWYWSFSFWFISLSVIISSPILIAANGIFHSILWLSNIPLYIYTTPSLSIHLLMAIQVASVSWLLWIVLLWTLGCMHLFKLEFSPGIDPRVGLLDHMVVLVFSFSLVSVTRWLSFTFYMLSPGPVIGEYP